MEGSFSPILRRIAGEIISKPKRTSRLPTEVCLEDWWLSIPADGDGDGLAVSGRPLEFRRDETARSRFNLASPLKGFASPVKGFASPVNGFASPARRYASREFHSTKIVKRHDGTLLETSDGFFISLCGFINKNRTQQNGFSSEICLDFIDGFPFNWNDYTAHSTDTESKTNENIFDSYTPTVLDSLNGAQLHDLVLSFTDKERDLFIEKIRSTLMLNTQEEDEVEVQHLTTPCTSDDLVPNDSISKASPPISVEQPSISRTFVIGLPSRAASKKQRRRTSQDVSS